jgi:PPOX class probable F420-dependent enzyme
MFEIDATSEFGQRVIRRLNDEQVIWLTTVHPGGMPQLNPVWFFWENGTFLIYTQPGSYKLRNLASNPKVSVHFNADSSGGDVVIFAGEASTDESTPPANRHPAYLAKYNQGITDIGMTPETFAQSYSVPVRVKPVKLRGF